VLHGKFVIVLNFMKRFATFPCCNRLIAITIGSLLLITGCATRTCYPALKIPFDKNELVGDWIGFNNRDNSCYKLELNSRGEGVLCSEFQSGTTDTIKISSWKIQGHLLICNFKGESTPSSPLMLRCDIKINLLVGILAGRGKWSENITFRRKQFFENVLLK